MSSQFHITTAEFGESHYVALYGNLDVTAETSLAELPAQVNHAIVRFDFSEVKRINSMGIAILLRCLKRISHDQRTAIYVKGLSQTNTILFKMTGIFQLATLEK